MTKKFNGFTLAEVLITLGIIGVVAAMTMPTLINQTNGAQYRAAYKKALSAISQGVTLNVALDDISFADTVQGQPGKTDPVSGKTGTTLAGLLQSRMNIVKVAGSSNSGYGESKKGTSQTATTDFPGKIKADLICVGNETTGDCKDHDAGDIVSGAGQEVSPDTFLFFNDSSMLAIDSTKAYQCTQISSSNTEGESNKMCYGVIDVNGVKGPNKVVSCDGDTTGSSCEVKSPTDIYPVRIYDQTILPASDAASAVLYGK